MFMYSCKKIMLYMFIIYVIINKNINQKGGIIMTNSEEQITKIRSLLGVESSGKWIELMDYIYLVLSDVLTIGKPTKKAIEQSIIGENGFTSWREMFTTSQEKGGFGSNYSSYEAWKRAYAVVTKYPYLRELELTASQINTINRETKGFFPANLSEYEALLNERDNKLKQSHSNSLKTAHNRITELERGILSITNKSKEDSSVLFTEIEKFKVLHRQAELDKARALDELLELTRKNEVLKSQSQGKNKEIDDRELKIKSLEKDLANLKAKEDLLNQKVTSTEKELKSSTRETNSIKNKIKSMNFVQRLSFLFKKENNLF